MRSKANIKGHPLHPVLISFPIAFFVGTLLFEAIGVATGRGDLNHIAYYLEIAGIVFALLAAVPGVIDLVYTVPPKSSGKKRGVRHGIINVTVVIIFSIAWYMRRQPDTSVYLLLALETVGVVLLTIAGWLGGTLVYRNEIGIDLRYANAGKWKELTVQQDSGPVEIAGGNELKTDQMMLVHVNGKRIVLGRAESGYVAFDDSCTHRGGSLAGGKEPIKTYSLSEANGKVYVIIDY